MPTPLPHQLLGATFLANGTRQLLADAPRVGKTGTFILACDFVFASKILVVTKSSARADWGFQFRQWQGFKRRVQVIYSAKDPIDPTAEVIVVGWGMIFDKNLHTKLMGVAWDAIGLDEAHEAKSLDAKRTVAVYGADGTGGLASRGRYVWALTGTPAPNSPLDLFPMLRAMCPNRLQARPGKSWPNVSTVAAFTNRYVVVKKRSINGKMVEVPIGGKNEEELRERLRGFWMRRTQESVGIRKPIYSVFALHADEIPDHKMTAEAAEVLAAAEYGDTASLDMHLGPIRRLTGVLKAHSVIQAVSEALDDGLDKVVLMAWHTEVINILKNGLSRYGVVGIDGKTAPTKRAGQVADFQEGRARVFVGQVLAAGEAIDLSSSAELWFVESSFVPKDMAQASLRITNHSQKRQPLVRVCALEGSIDEALMQILTRKVQSIRILYGV